jgi:hypothetical protein
MYCTNGTFLHVYEPSDTYVNELFKKYNVMIISTESRYYTRFELIILFCLPNASRGMEARVPVRKTTTNHVIPKHEQHSLML